MDPPAEAAQRAIDPAPGQAHRRAQQRAHGIPRVRGLARLDVGSRVLHALRQPALDDVLAPGFLDGVGRAFREGIEAGGVVHGLDRAAPVRDLRDEGHVHVQPGAQQAEDGRDGGRQFRVGGVAGGHQQFRNPDIEVVGVVVEEHGPV